MSFIKDSMKEFDHIVWPTASETKKYFVTVVSMIVVLTILLFLVGTALSSALFSLKSQLGSTAPTTTTAPIGDLKLDGVNVDTVPVTDTPTPAPVVPVVPTP